MRLDWDPRPALGVVMAAGGYPNDYDRGEVISGLDDAARAGCTVFHAGTRVDGESILTHGGRVLYVTTLDKTIKAAQKKPTKV